MLIGLPALLKKNILLFLLLCAAFAIYFPVLFHGHISWDDPEMVFKNKAVQQFDLATLFSNHYVGNYIPVTMLFHALTWFFFGGNEWGHHLISILLHLLNAILVYRLGNKLFKNSTVALCGTAVFLLHPLQVESVAWISELKNLSSTFFYLLSVLSYLSYKEKSKTNNYRLSFVFFVTACLCKPSAVVLPLLLFFFDWFIFREKPAQTWLNKIPFLLVSVLFGLINLKTQAADLFINRSHEFAYSTRFAFAGFALLKYFLITVWPQKLSVIYPYADHTTLTLISGFITWLLVIALIVFLFVKKKWNLIFICAFVLCNLILVLQFIPFGEALYADRYAYVPLIAAGWALGLVFSRLKLIHPVVIFAPVLVLSLPTLQRISLWRNALILYEDIIRKYPGQFVALNSAGVECMFLNQHEKAENYFNEAVKSAPSNYKSYYNRGLLYLKTNEPANAIRSFNQSLAIYDYNKAYIGRAGAYLMLGDMAKAMSDARLVLSADTNNERAHFILGNCYNELNRLDEALDEFNKCLALNGEEAEYYFKRAIVFGKKQDFKACLGDLNICLQLKPGLTEAYYWRGVAKVNLGKTACDDFMQAAKSNFEPAVMAFNKYCR